MRVLIVDDHLLFRDGLVSLLKSEPDFEIVGTASTVHEAVAQAHLLRPELILMDFSLPDGTGLEATQRILAQLPDCKIVFLTVYDVDEKLFAAIRQGAKGYLLKNMPIENLLASLRGLQRGESAISRAMFTRVLEEFSHTPPVEQDLLEFHTDLTPRELQVLRELLTGATNRQIATNLVISENTVKRHVNSIINKLGVQNRREAIRYAKNHGLK